MEVWRIRRARQFLSLQAGRGLAAVLVVIHHAALLTGAFNFSAGHLGVEFFFVLSGIVILMAHWDDIGNPRALSSFVWKRFRRIYPIYWVALLPQLIWIISRPRHDNLYQRDPWVIISSIILVHIHSFHTTITVAWTLFHEILFYAFFALLILNRRLGSLAMLLWLAASFFFFNEPNPYGAHFFSPLHLIFALGMIAAWLMRRGPIPWPIASFTAGVFLFARASYVMNKSSMFTDRNSLLAGFGAMLITLGLVELERRGQLQVYAWLVLLGDASYSIYLVHYPILFVLSPRMLNLLPQRHLPVLCGMTFLTLLAIAFGIVFHLLIERPLLKWVGGLRRPTV